jgi:hypothetical protein
MHVLGKPHLLVDRGILRVTDYHPHRVARAQAAAATVPEEGGGEDKSSRRRPRGGPDYDHDTARGEPPRGGSGGGVQIPYVEKDIPLLDGLRSGCVRCILGEDVVVLLEVGHHFRRRSMTHHSTRLVPADLLIH